MKRQFLIDLAKTAFVTANHKPEIYYNLHKSNGDHEVFINPHYNTLIKFTSPAKDDSLHIRVDLFKMDIYNNQLESKKLFSGDFPFTPDGNEDNEFFIKFLQNFDKY